MNGMRRSDQVRSTLIGLFRDLRGFTMATNSRRNYAMLFDWLYPDHMPLIRRTLEAYTGELSFSFVCVFAPRIAVSLPGIETLTSILFSRD